ncbi:hypothetical protein [Lacticaseibacillus nasuensis]|uniref:Uncharacterized protein n=2 Tax=Lacticaseibacillus TaxID=2759736 RepID=A0A0R1JTA5_9LACO|nr:hypothetical protein [Lacticaseibacillus nasuensis]KRK71700.1 hypothetical protein FD02_GL001942 [Lacticaseibacillus nasuensis JCM 17158]
MNDQTLLTLAAAILTGRIGDGPAALTKALHLAPTALTDEHVTLTHAQRDRLRYLFTDYEWMLAKKMAVLDATDPEEGGIVARYQAAKARIARSWLAAPNLATRYVKEPLPDGGQLMHLQLRLDYGEHGLVDVLDFVVPETVAKHIEAKQIDLLTWAKQYLLAEPKTE